MLQRALSISDIEKYNPTVLPFEGEWEAAIGQPELTGTWLVSGNSANGKTRFVLQACRYIASFKRRIAYDSLEEGLSKTMQDAIRAVRMRDIAPKFILLDKEPIADLKERLNKQKSPDIVVIDSVQYSGLTYAGYKELRDNFRKKLFIITSHADGKEPAGRVAKAIKYDANIKTWVEGFKAFSVSRYGGGQPYTVWTKGASDYWGESSITI